MADFGQQTGNALPAVDAPVSGTTHLVPNLRSYPSPQRRPVRGRRGGHGRAQQNTESPPVNAAGYHQPVGQWEGVPPPVENIAPQSQPQDPWYIGAAYDAMAHYHPPPLAVPDLAAPYEYRDAGINNYARVAQYVRVQGQAIAPPALDMGIFNYAALHAAPGPAGAIFHHGPVPNEPATEALRQLANRYLQQANTQVDMVGIEQDPAGGFKVVITLKSAVLL
ncbi:hypothetical protein BJV74DRAFT_853968 [Russula compacta]|nr:hypothetical protein BJV74DRAFT_853968 [Russula compacta]